MSGRYEASLKCRWREIDTLGQHAVEEALEALDVARSGLRKARNLRSIRKESPEPAVDVIRRERHRCAARRIPDAVGESCGRTREPRVKTGRRDSVERGESGRHRDRVA